MRNWLWLVLTVSLAACGGSGGGKDRTTTPGNPPTFAISGAVVSGITDAPMAGVTITLSGTGAASTTTDASGNYRFGNLENGAYNIEASLIDAAFSPGALGVTVNGANVSAQDIKGFRGTVVDSNIEFLPQSYLSTEQLRVSLELADGQLVYTDSSDAPLKKQALDGSPPTVLAERFTGASNVVLHGDDVYWVADGDLYRMMPGGQVLLLADGLRTGNADVTSDIVVDDTHVYWVDQAAAQSCSPPCDWVIEKIPLDGGTAVELATADRRIDSLKGDAASIYWQEGSHEPWSADCECGSKVKVIDKAGGTATLLVDGSLNGGLPEPPPGHIPASWYPTGGIAIAGDQIIFAFVLNASYELRSVPVVGGAVTDLGSVPSDVGFSRTSIMNITAQGGTVFWIDRGNSTVNSMPASGGAITELAAGIAEPGGLAVNATDVFWSELGAFAGCCRLAGAGQLSRVPLAGGQASVVVDGLDAPVAVAADSTGVTWTEHWRIGRLDSGSASPVTIKSGIASDLAQIAVANSNVYVLDGDFIKFVPLAGGMPEKVAPARGGSLDNISFVDGDITADNQNIYWSIHSVSGSTVVRQTAQSGGDSITLSGGGGIPNPQDCYWRVAVDAAAVYWSEGSQNHPVGCAIKKAPIGGGIETTLIDEAFVADFTVDGEDVYYSEFLGPSIRKLPVAGGSSALVADGVKGMVMANDDNRVYWLDWQYDTVGFISKASGTDPGDATLVPALLVMDPNLVFDNLAIDASSIVLSESQTGSLFRIE